MASTIKPAGTVEQYKSFPGRHYYPSQQAEPRGLPLPAPALKLLALAGALLALRGLLALFGI